MTLGEGSRVVLMPDTGGVGRRARRIRQAELGVEVLTIDGAPEVEALEAQIAEWCDGRTGRRRLLAAGARRRGIADRPRRRRPAGRRCTSASSCSRRRCARSADERTFLVSGTRLGGRHGYDADGATSVLGGAVTGFTKALSQERPGRARQGGRLRPEQRRCGPRRKRCSRRRCAIPARSRSATPTSCAGPSG